MARWDPDARDRLQRAAMSLYFERGFDAVTVAEIAERAGLTKRTFFRHFADKRDVVFARAQALEDAVVAALADADPGVPPIRAVVAALARGGEVLSEYRQHAGAVRALIASSAELRERDLLKTASLTAAVAGSLQQRGLDPGTAALTARAGATVFAIGYDRWIDGGGGDFATVLEECLGDLRRVLDPAPGANPGR